MQKNKHASSSSSPRRNPSRRSSPPLFSSPTALRPFATAATHLPSTRSNSRSHLSHLSLESERTADMILKSERIGENRCSWRGLRPPWSPPEASPSLEASFRANHQATDRYLGCEHDASVSEAGNRKSWANPRSERATEQGFDTVSPSTADHLPSTSPQDRHAHLILDAKRLELQISDLRNIQFRQSSNWQLSPAIQWTTGKPDTTHLPPKTSTLLPEIVSAKPALAA